MLKSPSTTTFVVVVWSDRSKEVVYFRDECWLWFQWAINEYCCCGEIIRISKELSKDGNRWGYLDVAAIYNGKPAARCTGLGQAAVAKGQATSTSGCRKCPGKTHNVYPIVQDVVVNKSRFICQRLCIPAHWNYLMSRVKSM